MGLEAPEFKSDVVPEITTDEFKKLLDSGKKINILDVREPYEYEISKIDGAKLIPISRRIDGSSASTRVGLISSAEYIVHCQHSRACAMHKAILPTSQKIMGSKNSENLKGGINVVTHGPMWIPASRNTKLPFDSLRSTACRERMHAQRA